jgi:hypothetical protein
MLVGNKVSHSAVSEAYCLLSAYIREEGTISADYNKEYLLEFCKFVAEILKHPENFSDLKKESFKDKTKSPEHDGLGLA